jgi:VWFA-related protein
MLFAFNQIVQLKSPISNNWNETARRVKRFNPKGETAIYDAISDASQWLALDSGPARHIMILVSDGEENKSKATIETAINNALEAEATIYSVNVSDEKLSDDAALGASVLKHLAEATGGLYLNGATYFDDPDSDHIAEAFSKVRRELRSQYALAYKPSNPGVRAFHHLQVLVPQRLRVHCRSGYYVK